MKNIFLIPTDKPSRLCLDSKGKLWFAPNSGYTIADGKQNIYITSDEEIKEGDYMYDIDGDVGKAIGSNMKEFEGNKKIILTTDQDLIKDGVQAIDDEFLEWFVKNPSCESVEVEKEYIFFTKEGYGDWYYNDYKLSDLPINYKIIITKQEPKQETLEEVQLAILFHNTYENLAPNFGYETRADTKSFETTTPNGMLMIAVCKEIIKWQQERSYSEEEVIKLLIYCKDRFGGSGLEDYTSDSEVKQWFEQFKKK
jgi:hypothetical protein